MDHPFRRLTSSTALFAVSSLAKLLFNQYGVILVNPAKHPHVKKELGQQFIDWLISHEGQKAIADYKIEGEQVFWPQRDNSGT